MQNGTSILNVSMSGHIKTVRRFGFTLIEVLIGLVVLGLGLLGLASVFPAVVYQQRTASDAIEGASITEGVKAYVRSSSTFNANALTTRSHQGAVRPPGILRALQRLNDLPAFGEDGLWVIPESGQGTFALAPIQDITLPGDMMLQARFLTGYNGTTPTYDDAEYSLPLLDRLIPAVAQTPRSPGSSQGEAEPRFVWDFMIRRVGTPNQPTEGDGLQTAIFVRRIDVGIRRPAGGSLVDVFRPLDGTDRTLVPVAADNTTGEASLNGIGDYSLILTAYIELIPGNNAIASFELPVNTLPQTQALAQVGQKFVGPSGQVHTVVSVDSTSGVLSINVSPGVTLPAGETRYDVWFTPQVPVAVEVFDTTAR